MDQLKFVISGMISIDDREFDSFFSKCHVTDFEPRALLSRQGEQCDSIFFIVEGLTRSLIEDHRGDDHTIHFSIENQFVSEYSSFLRKTPATNSIQALEKTRAVVMPRECIEWGYRNLQQGDRLGRLIAEYYFVYFDSRIKNQYLYSPAERYANITKVFPNIHNRVPQHMIASYLGVSPVHLSRLKKTAW